MKVTHEVDSVTGEVRVIATWHVREQVDALKMEPLEQEVDQSMAADILLDAERTVRRIEECTRRKMTHHIKAA